MIKGKTIAITRSKDDSEEFIDLITRENGNVLPLPTIEIVSKGEKIVDEFLTALENNDPDFSVFMSSKAVSLLFDTAKSVDKFEKLRLAVANTTVIAVGPKTRSVLEKENVKVRSGASTPFLKDLLEKIGLSVIELYLYDICTFSDTSQWNEFRNLFSQNKVDGIIFTSASSVNAFFEIMTKDRDEKKLVEMLQKTTIVSIGPFTSDELKKFQVKNIIADVHTVPGSVEAMDKAFSLAEAI